jgi:hypothetical protein
MNFTIRRPPAIEIAAPPITAMTAAIGAAHNHTFRNEHDNV